MTRDRRRQTRNRPLRGLSLAWLALAVQVLLPFFLAIDIARADTAGGNIPICSALDSAHHDSGPSNHGTLAGGCPICTALAAGQGFTAPPPVPLPPPRSGIRLALGHDASSAPALLLVTVYRSRAPPLFV